MPEYHHLTDEQIRAYTDRIKRAQHVFAEQQRQQAEAQREKQRKFYERDFGRWQHKAQTPPLHGATDFVKGRDGVWRFPT